MQPLWISRHFDSIYSVAITEQAVYVGGHFGFIESPESCPTTLLPGPRQRRLRHRPGPGRLRPRRRRSSAATTSPRSHPTTGKALEWYPSVARTRSRATRPWRPPRAACSSAATACSRAASAPAASASTTSTRVAFPAAAARHHDHHPDRGPRGRQQHAVHDHRHRARHHRDRRPGPGADPGPRQRPVPAGQRHRLHTTFSGTNNSLNATLGAGHGTTRTWSIPATIATNRNLRVYAQAFTARHRRHRRLDQGRRRGSSRSAPRTRRRRPASAGRAASRPRRPSR